MQVPLDVAHQPMTGDELDQARHHPAGWPGTGDDILVGARPGGGSSPVEGVARDAKPQFARNAVPLHAEKEAPR